MPAFYYEKNDINYSYALGRGTGSDYRVSEV